ncbi:uncharacterized protein ACA1_385900 [Acanthamoeba castellanii str. Neff]|uniref:Uncharacterized protein n=1 Tax=Acanthamoeba castellanii (strain ATCC 30010 / Neff) TaxID=1257118 RepID=L8H997_ACACF|nr:uncharacterized protein ACA1_385900 [Acanthamoeba castellanii str. Neff]ELR21812.1 hypothetical protein ACA1_385900 [Acanthamoeba castellanii str. Neff]
MISDEAEPSEVDVWAARHKIEDLAGTLMVNGHSKVKDSNPHPFSQLPFLPSPSQISTPPLPTNSQPSSAPLPQCHQSPRHRQVCNTARRTATSYTSLASSTLAHLIRSALASHLASICPTIQKKRSTIGRRREQNGSKNMHSRRRTRVKSRGGRMIFSMCTSRRSMMAGGGWPWRGWW